MTLKFIVMSDLHLVAEGELSMTLDTAARLETAVETINARYADADFCILAGDLADLGQAAAYRRLQAILSKLIIPVHITLGNHDDRDEFRKAVDRHDDVAAGHCTSVVDAAGLRLVMLDTLEHVNEVPGVVGEAQRQWLAKTLDAAPDVPTLVLMHHHPSPTPEPPKGALQDTAALMDVIRPRKQVKALLFGHTHVWRRSEVDGVHHVNLPAVAYHFESPQPLGWCRLEPNRDGSAATIVLNCTGGERTHDGERAELAWRGA